MMPQLSSTNSVEFYDAVRRQTEHEDRTPTNQLPRRRGVQSESATDTASARTARSAGPTIQSGCCAGDRNLRVADCRRVGTVHADRVWAWLGGVRSVQPPQPGKRARRLLRQRPLEAATAGGLGSRLIPARRNPRSRRPGVIHPFKLNQVPAPLHYLLSGRNNSNQPKRADAVKRQSGQPFFNGCHRAGGQSRTHHLTTAHS